MTRNFELKGAQVKDPRVMMRVIIGVLLVANLTAAILAFKPFGGSAEDLRTEQQSLSAQLTAARTRLATSQRLVDKVQTARREGDQFLGEYFMTSSEASALVLTELTELAKESGIKMGQAQFSREEVEGSNSLVMQSWQVGFEGTYANFAKFVNLVDKSPRFLIIENMSAAAPQQQGGQSLNVTLKIDSFIRDAAGELL
jgi:type IV pilus assembly protein PilO